MPPAGLINQDLPQAVAGLNLGGPTQPAVTGAQHALHNAHSMPSLPGPAPPVPVRVHSQATFAPMAFHGVTGQHVALSPDRTVAVRTVGEYCNAYVFTHRPLRCGERMVIQIWAVDPDFVGGLAFGMTACDPQTVKVQELPDDSDLLLDRPEYWVVNKDVCSSSEIGDELTFHLTEEGKIFGDVFEFVLYTTWLSHT